MTNADVIRQMTDDELYKFMQAFETGNIDYSLTFCSLCKDMGLDCDECFKRWLFNDAHDYNGLLADKGINSGYADRKTEPFDKDTKPQTETKNLNENSNVISVYDGVSEAVRCAMCSNPNKSDRGCDGACSCDEKLYERIMKAIAESIVKDEPQTERSDDAE